MNVFYKPLPSLFRRQPSRHSFARTKHVARLQREAAILKAPEARKRKDRRRFPSRVRSSPLVPMRSDAYSCKVLGIAGRYEADRIGAARA